MKKEETIKRYGKGAWERKLEQERARHKANKEEANARSKKYREAHPEEVRAYNKKYYEAHPEEVKAAVKKYQEEHPEEAKVRIEKWKEAHPENVKAIRDRQNRKGGKYYERNLKGNHTGLRGARNVIRSKHQKQYKQYKNIIAPESQIHHEWIPKTEEYTGIALVEKDAHMHGFVDVIEILDGKITLLTEEEVKNGKKNSKEEIE